MTNETHIDPLDAAFSAPKAGDGMTQAQIAELLGKPQPAPRPSDLRLAPSAPTDAPLPDPDAVLSAQLDAAFSAPKSGDRPEGAQKDPDYSGPPAAFRTDQPTYEPGDSLRIADTLREPSLTASSKQRGKTIMLAVILLFAVALIWGSTQVNLFSMIRI